MIERMLICHKKNDPVLEFIIKKMLENQYTSNVQVFFVDYYNLTEFKEIAFSNNVDLIITHCHDSNRDYEIIINTINDILKRLNNCTIVLTIDSSESLITYKRELLNKFYFDYLFHHDFQLELIELLNSISKNPKPNEKLIYISENYFIPFNSTLFK
jgi:hypothetical protein